MFGKKAAKKAEKLAEEKEAQSAQFMAQAATPSPLQTAEDKSNLEFLDWESGKSGPVDVEKAPGLNPYLDLYRASTAANEGTQEGQGLITMGAEGSNPELAALIKQNRADRQKQVAGGALADAYRQRSAAAHGYVLPSSSLTQGRQLSLAGLSSGNASDAWRRYQQAQQSSGFFNSAFYRAMQESAKAAAAGA